MWRTGLLLLAACSFTPGVASSAGGQLGDAARAPDAAPRDASYMPCNIMTMGMPMPAGMLGGMGGGTPSPPTSCNPGEFAVGMAFDYAPNGVGGQEGVIVDAHVRCALLTRDGAGHIATTPAEVQTTATNGFCITSVISIAEQDCPSGSVLVGMTGNAAGSSLYNTVALHCAAVHTDLTLATATTALAFDTGSYSDQPQAATCQANSALVTFGVRDGCADDQLAPSCAALACGP